MGIFDFVAHFLVQLFVEDNYALPVRHLFICSVSDHYWGNKNLCKCMNSIPFSLVAIIYSLEYNFGYYTSFFLSKKK